jgi:glycosyltransferase involved in cell wall biosynthesis
MPCLNEARTVGRCVTKALTYLAHRSVKGEVVVADNGSTEWIASDRRQPRRACGV